MVHGCMCTCVNLQVQCVLFTVCTVCAYVCTVCAYACVHMCVCVCVCMLTLLSSEATCVVWLSCSSVRKVWPLQLTMLQTCICSV